MHTCAASVPQVYRKSFKEFTDLRLVQQLGGHQGVVWTLKFSRNGKFLASGDAAAAPETRSCCLSVARNALLLPLGWFAACDARTAVAGRPPAPPAAASSTASTLPWLALQRARTA
jgi:hypothetical protein